MQYDIEKLVDILVLLAKKGQTLTKLRTTKLLYFIDKYHLRKYGRFVLNDRYYRLQYGPIPSLSLNYINDFFSPDVTVSGKVVKNPLRKFFSPAKFKGVYVKLKLEKDVNFHSLSDSELKIIDWVIKKFGNLSTSTLINISHEDKTSKETPEPNEIEPELFLDGLRPEAKEAIKKLMEINRENDCVNIILNK